MGDALDRLREKHAGRVSAAFLDEPDERPDRKVMLQRHPEAGETFTQRKVFRPLRGKWLPCPDCAATWDRWCDDFCFADDPWNPWHNSAVRD